MSQLQGAGETRDEELQRLDVIESEADQRLPFIHSFILFTVYPHKSLSSGFFVLACSLLSVPWFIVNYYL